MRHSLQEAIHDAGQRDNRYRRAKNALTPYQAEYDDAHRDRLKLLLEMRYIIFTRLEKIKEMSEHNRQAHHSHVTHSHLREMFDAIEFDGIQAKLAKIIEQRTTDTQLLKKWHSQIAEAILLINELSPITEDDFRNQPIDVIGNTSDFLTEHERSSLSAYIDQLDHDYNHD